MLVQKRSNFKCKYTETCTRCTLISAPVFLPFSFLKCNFLLNLIKNYKWKKLQKVLFLLQFPQFHSPLSLFWLKALTNIFHCKIVNAIILSWLSNTDAEVCSSLSNRRPQRSRAPTNQRVTFAPVPNDKIKKKKRFNDHWLSVAIYIEKENLSRRVLFFITVCHSIQAVKNLNVMFLIYFVA